MNNFLEAILVIMDRLDRWAHPEVLACPVLVIIVLVRNCRVIREWGGEGGFKKTP